MNSSRQTAMSDEDSKLVDIFLKAQADTDISMSFRGSALVGLKAVLSAKSSGPADDANDAARWRWMMAHLGICEQMIKDTGDRTGDWAVMFRNRVDEQRSATEDDGK